MGWTVSPVGSGSVRDDLRAGHLLGGQRGSERVFHEHGQRQQLTWLHGGLGRLLPGAPRKGAGPGEAVVQETGHRRLGCRGSGQV